MTENDGDKYVARAIPSPAKKLPPSQACPRATSSHHNLTPVFVGPRVCACRVLCSHALYFAASALGACKHASYPCYRWRTAMRVACSLARSSICVRPVTTDQPILLTSYAVMPSVICLPCDDPLSPNRNSDRLVSLFSKLGRIQSRTFT